MASEKDHLRDKLHDKEKAEEDRFIAEREKAILERKRQAAEAQAAAETVSCPRGHGSMVTAEFRGVKVEECPSCHGMWLDKGELETIAGRERDSWLGGLFLRSRR